MVWPKGSILARATTSFMAMQLCYNVASTRYIPPFQQTAVWLWLYGTWAIVVGPNGEWLIVSLYRGAVGGMLNDDMW